MDNEKRKVHNYNASQVNRVRSYVIEVSPRTWTRGGFMEASSLARSLENNQLNPIRYYSVKVP